LKPMNTKGEEKKCQNCRKNFEIEAQDFLFYERLKVPPPTFCPLCRLQRRLAFFNIFNLYKRPCDLCKKETISIYRPDTPYTVYCPKCWWSDGWDPLSYGRDYDFSRPFFEQVQELWRTAPLMALGIDVPTINDSEYTNLAGHLKNCYLIYHADFDEDCAYGFYLNYCKSVFDCGPMISCELCYDSMHSYRSSRCVGCRSQITESIDCVFLKDCMNCQNCFASANLRNKKYHIFNKPYSKDDYFKEIDRWDLGSYRSYNEAKKLAEEHWKNLLPKPHMEEFNTNCSGSHVFQSKNSRDCFEVMGVEDCKYMLMMYAPPIKDCYDVSSWGNNLSRSYDCCNVGEFSSDLRFCSESGINLYDAEYCKISYGGAHHFGCVAMKKGEYCILNKKYSKEDYEKLRARIIEHMNTVPYTDKMGRVYGYGEFFPAEVSPFVYNETIAGNFFPLSESEMKRQGYRFIGPEKRNYGITKKAADLPDHINEVKDDILNDVIACAKCEKGYKIIAMELSFLRDRQLPLPRECPFCRIKGKFDQWVSNLRLIDRICNKCGAAFRTNYTAEEAPKIYCKKCYQAEVA
jgi:hypothetical protein